MEVQLNIVKDVLFKKVQELQTETIKEKAVVSEIEGTRSSLKHLNHQLHKLDFETLKQQEIMYSQVNVTLMNIFNIGYSNVIVVLVKIPKCSKRTKISKHSWRDRQILIMGYHVRSLFFPVLK